MKLFRLGFSSFLFIIAGFLMAFIGISNPNSAEAVAENMKERLAFGLKNSPVEIYFVTDWYCPSCKKIEPLIEKLYPTMRAKATFFFIDYPIHKKSMNFSPYNLAFLINYKQELPHQDFDMKKTVIETIHGTGISIIYTSLVLIAGFIIFSFSGFGGTQALGWLTSLTLVTATLTNLILLPALLMNLGRPKRK